VRSILTGIYIENAYPALTVGVIASQDELFLIDSPLRSDDAKEWLGQISKLGTPRFLAVLDQHPDRVIGARNIEIPRAAHSATSDAVANLPDTFKGASQPVGSEVDRIKRVTGITRLTPDLTFSDTLLIHHGDQPIQLTHQPGPTPGAMWVVLHERKVAFVGDAVTVSEPPFLGFAQINAWLDALDVLRDPPFDSYKIVTSRDGLVDRDAINEMARFLRKVPVRLERMHDSDDAEAAAESAASELIEDFKVTASRWELCHVRLKAGLIRLFRRDHPVEE
jgi:glyoxylase-like metal-dependent hydrolase (beta-lactamase superfamily II)